MSPASYRTAPPRGSMLADGPRAPARRIVRSTRGAALRRTGRRRRRARRGPGPGAAGLGAQQLRCLGYEVLRVDDVLLISRKVAGLERLLCQVELVLGLRQQVRRGLPAGGARGRRSIRTRLARLLLPERLRQ